MANEKKAYFCLGNVRHDGKRYTPLSRIELTDAEAKPLLSAHAITKHDPAKKVDAEAADKAKVDAEANQAKK